MGCLCINPVQCNIYLAPDMLIASCFRNRTSVATVLSTNPCGLLQDSGISSELCFPAVYALNIWKYIYISCHISALKWWWRSASFLVDNNELPAPHHPYLGWLWSGHARSHNTIIISLLLTVCSHTLGINDGFNTLLLTYFGRTIEFPLNQYPHHGNGLVCALYWQIYQFSNSTWLNYNYTSPE